MNNSSCNNRNRPTARNKHASCGIKGSAQQTVPDAFYSSPSLEELKKEIAKDDIVLAYVVATCKPIKVEPAASLALIHTGSGPNLDGGRITLCTCKHRMRTSPVFFDKKFSNRSIWIAGFSSSAGGGKNWLYYLMKVGMTFSSQQEIYDHLKATPVILAAKLATNPKAHGDIFEPKTNCSNSFDPSLYELPHPGHSHRKEDEWKKDISVEYYGRNPKMLLGKKGHSYCYPSAQILRTGEPMTQGNQRLSGEDFIHALKYPSAP